jgi:hypothetical protein
MFTEAERIDFQYQKQIKNLLKKQTERTNSILENLLRKDNLDDIEDFLDSKYYDVLTSTQQRLVHLYRVQLINDNTLEVWKIKGCNRMYWLVYGNGEVVCGDRHDDDVWAVSGTRDTVKDMDGAFHDHNVDFLC